ncbi:hypothetical protein Q7P35_001391 [Cladosporium inversicolor]
MSCNNNKFPLPNLHDWIQAILSELPECHGTVADPSRNARRRLRRKAKAALLDRIAEAKATFESAKSLIDPSIPVAGAHDFTVYHTQIDPSQSQQESQSLSPPRDEQNQGHAEDSSGQARSEEQGITAPRRTDSWKSGNSPQQKKKSALSASSTSAEIVETLLPDRPAPVRWPRRTTSVDVCHARKMSLRDSLEEKKA